ncbi:hypothetical protein [Rubellimicrobium mesophilum]|uniref:hypothetical protein n=1 Tax=Rubellimicrobium mesophilum TaxID=1123067 RepID=UPI0012E23C82|nr:hypothetical protein [Rubellimicrobium mesophilum]
MADIVSVHKILLNFEKRAENKPEAVIAETFVDSAPLLDILQAPGSVEQFGVRASCP